MTFIDGPNFKDVAVGSGEKAGEAFDKANFEDYGGGKIIGPLLKRFGNVLDIYEVFMNLRNADSDAFNDYWNENLKGVEFGSKEDVAKAVTDFYEKKIPKMHP